MKRLLVLPVLALVALSSATGAPAKGAYPAQICGSSGCRALSAAARDALANALFGPFQLADAPRAAPYYMLRLRSFDGRGSVPRPWSFAPSRGALRVTSEDMRPYWRTLPAGALAALNAAAGRVRPYPASAWRSR